MGNEPFEGPALFGIVEVDETLVGGKVKGKDHAYKGNKGWVVGAIQREGKVRIERIPNIKRGTLHDFIKRTVKNEAEAIYTDELRSYIGIADHDTRHETVRHSEEEWVVGDVHTNSIEGIWSLFKRSLYGRIPQDEHQAHGSLHRGTRMAIQQPQQSPHFPRYAGSDHGH